MKYTRGFTVIELLIVIVLLAGASVLFFIQKNNVEVAAKDEMRKTSVNAMYYSLEEVYFKQNQAYPRSLSTETLPSVDPELFKDPSGVKVGEADSNFSYEATDCDNDKCKAYTLRTVLQNEDDYIKTNRTD